MEYTKNEQGQLVCIQETQQTYTRQEIVDDISRVDRDIEQLNNALTDRQNRKVELEQLLLKCDELGV